jgi:hypothetical protein
LYLSGCNANCYSPLIGSPGRAAFIATQSKRMETAQMKGMNFDFSFGVKLSPDVFLQFTFSGEFVNTIAPMLFSKGVNHDFDHTRC